MESGVLSRICRMRKETCAPHECTSGVYVGLEHIDSGRFRLSRHGAPSEVRSAKSRFYPGDVLYGKLRPYLDKAVVAETDGICSTDILVLEPLEAPSWFLCGVLHTDPFIEHAKQTTHGVNHPRTSWSGIMVFESLSLSRREQKKTAAVLLKIQRAIEKQEQIIQSVRDLKKSTMQHVFTHGLRGEKTKMTEIGKIPNSWEVVELGPLAETVTKGSSPRWQGFAYRKSGVLFLRSQNVGWGRLLMDDVAYVDLSFNEKETRSIIKRGDLLINLVGASIGRAAVADERLEGANTNQAVGIARLSSGELVSEFAMYFLLTDAGQGEISYNKKEIARANISLTDIKNFRVAKPSPAEQLNIVQILRRLDDAQGLHESKRSVLQDLFKTTLNKLMTGGIRVMDLEIDVSEVN